MVLFYCYKSKNGVVHIKTNELFGAIHNAMYHQCRERGFATPVDTLIAIGVLSKKSYEDWRFGKIPYLEKACTVNLKTLSSIMYQMRSYAQKQGWKPSYCYYKQWGVKKKGGQGHKPVIPISFSKSGNESIEKSYSTHFVDEDRIRQLKQNNN